MDHFLGPEASTFACPSLILCRQAAVSYKVDCALSPLPSRLWIALGIKAAYSLISGVGEGKPFFTDIVYHGEDV